MGKSLRVDHVNDYKPPKDNDKLDDETRQLHEEGCAPKIQLSPSQIKREEQNEEIIDGVRLPMRLPIRDIKREKHIPKKVKSLHSQIHKMCLKIYFFLFQFFERKTKIVFYFQEKKEKKHKKEKKLKKDKKEKKSKKKKRSPSSSRGSSSGSDSDSNSERRRKKSRR